MTHPKHNNLPNVKYNDFILQSYLTWTHQRNIVQLPSMWEKEKPKLTCYVVTMGVYRYRSK